MRRLSRVVTASEIAEKGIEALLGYQLQAKGVSEQQISQIMNECPDFHRRVQEIFNKVKESANSCKMWADTHKPQPMNNISGMM